MIDRLTPAGKRAAALALLVVALALAYLAVIGPVIGRYRDYEERIDDLSHRLQQYRSLAQTRAVNQRLLDQLKRRDQAKRYYLSEHKPALASAELQGLVKRAVERAKGELLSTQAMSDQPGEGYAKVTVKVRMQGDIEALQKVLHALESSRPLLALNNVVIEPASVRRAPDPEGPNAATVLAISFDVTGYTREPAA
jgi:general secretion pathway protein M